jgi:hypothetical protein
MKRYFSISGITERSAGAMIFLDPTKIEVHYRRDAHSALRGSIKMAELKLSTMQREIDESDAEADLEEAAADALAAGKDLSERSSARRTKAQHDALVAEHGLLQNGLARLHARVIGLEREAAAEYAELARAREPILQNMFDTLAHEVAAMEAKASLLRARLLAFSRCANGATPQMLSNFARGLLVGGPAGPPQLNSPGQKRIDSERQAFREWKTKLESDAQAQLNL